MLLVKDLPSAHFTVTLSGVLASISVTSLLVCTNPVASQDDETANRFSQSYKIYKLDILDRLV